jgi:uncharacterized protein YecE (DUF72 family)
MSGQIHVGTSGWHYRHWRGVFYPEDLPARDWLGFYADHFSTVEINRSFYALPASKTLVDWCAQTSDRFLFTLKAPRTITHYKKLKHCTEQIDTLMRTLDTLGARLGPVLFQLPPRWRCNVRRLAQFLNQLPRGHRFVFEFRDPSWHTSEVFELLADNEAGLCIYDLSGQTSPLLTTTDFVYVRLHGPARAYTGQYHPSTLRGWISKARGWQRAGKDVYLFFDNASDGGAVKNARRMCSFLAKGV